MTTMQISDIPMSIILFDEEFNCRGPIAPIDVTDLANSIKERGLIQPVVVCPLTGHRLNANPGKQFLLIAGYRRFTAFKVNSETKIPAIIRKDMIDETEARFFNLSENLQRKDLNLLQEARALAKLERLGVSEMEASKKLNVGRGWVQVRYMVLRLPDEVQEEIAAGWMSQKQIRDCYSHFVDSGKEACFNVVKEFKDDKIKGRKGTRKKVKKKKAKDHSTKKARDRNEIFEMQAHVYEQLGGNSIVTRGFAWCAGEISDLEFHQAMQTFAETLNKHYRLPQ